MNKEERMLAIQNELNFGIETKDGTFYVPKDDVIKIVFDLLDEVCQPQLTIPEWVAAIVDKQKTTKLKFDDYDNEFFPYFKWSKEFDKQHGKFSSSYLLDAYLNPLTRDLVKVVEE